MRFVEPEEAAVLAAIAALAEGNPFLPERVESERIALRDGFAESGAVWKSEL